MMATAGPSVAMALVPLSLAGPLSLPVPSFLSRCLTLRDSFPRPPPDLRSQAL